jgi:hypothetical protein
MNSEIESAPNDHQRLLLSAIGVAATEPDMLRSVTGTRDGVKRAA